MTTKPKSTQEKLAEWYNIQGMSVWADLQKEILELISKKVNALRTIRGDSTILLKGGSETYNFEERVARKQGEISGVLAVKSLPEKLIEKLQKEKKTG